MRIWIGIILCGWCSLLVIWVYRRPKTFPQMMADAGRFLPGRFVRRRSVKVPPEKAAALYADMDPDEAVRSYIRFWWGLWYCSLILAATLCLGAVRLDQARSIRSKDVSLERPEFGAEDTSIVLELEAEDGKTQIQDKVRIRIPSKTPSEVETERILNTAEGRVRKYFDTEYLKREKWPEDIGSVQVLCFPAETEWIDTQGAILWEDITTSVETKIRVLLTAYGRDKEFEIPLRIDPRQETLDEKVAHMLERMDQGAYVTEDAVTLPTEDRDGVRYTWRPAGQNRQTDPKVYYLWTGLLPFLPVVSYRYRIRQKTLERRKRIYRSYPDMLNQFMILLGSGMSIMKAWEKMDADYREKKKRDHMQDPLFEEMLRAENRMRTGYSFGKAVRIMAENLKVQEIRQFASILAASWKRGDDHVLLHLKDLHDRSWEIRKNQARKASEEADTKLLLPLMMMLIVVIIIVLSPALMTMTV